jgi:hypothetical protein
MQQMRRPWNGNNRGIRSDDYGSELKLEIIFKLALMRNLFLAPSTYESLVHELEKPDMLKKQDPNSQVVKKVRFDFNQN